MVELDERLFAYSMKQGNINIINMQAKPVKIKHKVSVTGMSKYNDMLLVGRNDHSIELRNLKGDQMFRCDLKHNGLIVTFN